MRGEGCGHGSGVLLVRAPIVGQGAPIVGPPPGMADAVVAETVTDTMVGTVSDAAGKAVAAGVAGQALPEPYVPGSAERIPAELRLVLAGYVGIAVGLSASALACAAAAAFDFFGDAVFLVFTELFLLAVGLCIWVLWRALKALKAGIRFSRLLRRPSDARMATVMASERGGRTLILDSNPHDGTGRGYQPLSEVRLALWLKADMLVPGEG